MKTRENNKIRNAAILQGDEIVDEFFTCECGNPEHLVQVTFDPDIFCDERIVDRYPQLIMNIQLSHYLGFWRRLKVAFKYLFKIKDDTCHWDCCCIREDEIDKLDKMVQLYKDELSKITEAKEKRK